MWLFFRWSGVNGGELPWDEGASVDEDVADETGIFEGSKSRSGRGGVTKGRRVIFRSNSRRIALLY